MPLDAYWTYRFTYSPEAQGPQLSQTMSHQTVSTHENLRDAPVFSRFPQLPLEIRTLIWQEIAQLPRNLDIWAPNKGTVAFWDPIENNTSTFRPYKHVTTQPVPGILHACKESRKIGLESYELSFSTDYDQDGFIIRTPARIYRNSTADTICPMGPYDEDSHLFFYCDRNCDMDTPALAVNTLAIPGQPHFSTYIISGDVQIPEIMLYYTPSIVLTPGAFYFVEHDQTLSAASPLEKSILLKEATDLLTSFCDQDCYERKCLIKTLIGKEGLGSTMIAVSSLAEAEVMHHPDVKLVYMVVDGVKI